MTIGQAVGMRGSCSHTSRLPASSGAPPTPPAFVQQASTGAIAANVITVNAQTTAGNMLLVCVAAGSGSKVTAVADSKGNAYTVDAAVGTAGAAGLAHCTLTTPLAPGDTVTLTMTGGVASGAQLIELAHASTVDQVTTASAAQNPLTVGPLTPSQPGQLAFSTCTVGTNSGVVWTPPAGWTEVAMTAANNKCDSAFLTGPSGAVSATWTQSLSSNIAAILAVIR